MGGSMDDLGINVSDSVNTKEKFGNVQAQKAKLEELRKKLAEGIAVTVQLTDLSQKDKIIDLAWTMSKQSKKVSLIIVQAS
jgi:hypothetical protein